MLVRAGETGDVLHLRDADTVQALVERATIVDDMMRSIVLTQAIVSGREAVAITVRPVRRRASWIRIDPTPPAR